MMFALSQSRFTSRRSLLGKWFACALSLGLVSLQAASANAGEALDRLRSSKAARIGFSNFTPTSFIGPDGQATGAAPKLAEAFLRSLGVEKIESVVTEWSGLIGGLQAQRFDMIAAQMQIQPGRCEQIAFGDPEVSVQQAFLVRRGQLGSPKSFKDVAAGEKNLIGLLKGAGQIRFADIAGVPKERQILFPDYVTALAGLRAGRVNVIAGSSVTLRWMAKDGKMDDIDIITLSEQPLDEAGKVIASYAGMGFRKEDQDLVQAWNIWLADARKSGALATIIAPFGFVATDIAPASITASSACKP